MPTRSINTETAKRFSTWLAQWVEVHKYTQLQAAVIVGMTPSHFNQTLSGKSAVSIFQMEKVAASIDRDLADILIEGRQIIEGKKINSMEIKEEETELLLRLSAENKRLVLKTMKIFEAGGDDSKLLKKFIRRLS